MLEKALEVFEEKIKTPEELYKALHHKNYGLGSIVTQKEGHPLAHKAFQINHKKKTAKIDATSLEHLEKLSAAFLNEAEIDNVVIEKSNHRYAFTHALWLMHHDKEIPILPEIELKDMLKKIEAIDIQIERFQSFQDNLHENNENITYVRLKKTLTVKRTHLLDMKESLSGRARRLEREMEEERHKQTPGTKNRHALPEQQKPEKPDDASDTSTSPSTSGSDTLYINILQTPQGGPQATTSPASQQLSPLDTIAVSPPPDELQPSSGGQSASPHSTSSGSGYGEMSSPPSGHSRVSDFYDASTPLQSQAPTPSGVVRGLTDSPYLQRYHTTGTPQRSPAISGKGILTPLISKATLGMTPNQPSKRADIILQYLDQPQPQPSPHKAVARALPPLTPSLQLELEPPKPDDLIQIMLDDMVANTRSNLSICKELQKQYFISWVCNQNRATLISLSNYMQDVQDEVVDDPRFKSIRRDFFSSDANTQDWIDLRHAVKIRIMALEKARSTPSLVEGGYKFVVDQKSDLENRHHMGRHSGRFFTRWGKTKCLRLYEDEFVSARRVPKQSI